MTSSQAIIFDLDDTLYPEQSFVFSGYGAVAEFVERKWNIPSPRTKTELQKHFQNGNRNNTLGTWLDEHGFDQSHLQTLIAVYRDHMPTIIVFDGIRDLLVELSRENRLGLISDGFLATQQRKLTSLKISQYFSSIVFSDQWGRAYWKPAERPYRHALSQLGVSPEHAVYIGDNPEKDFVTANALGMRTIRVRRVGGIYADREPPSAEHSPNVVVTSTSELQAAIFD